MNAGDVYETKHCGKLVVISDGGSHNVQVRFINTGYETVTRREHIKSGSVKDRLMRTVFGVGYIGGTKYKSYENGKEPKSYRAWFGMMQRCYCDNIHKKRPTYKGCTVCEEWHNYQNFAEWYYENHPSDGKKYHIDKDILIEGNKHYSPDTCMFVTIKENVLKSQEKRMYSVDLISPYGEVVTIRNQSEFARNNGLAPANVNKLVHGKIKHCGGWRLRNDHRR